MFLPETYAGEYPDIKMFYIKAVMVCDPNNQFPEIFNGVTCANCNGIYKNDGWCGNNSYVHGVEGGLYLVQRK